MKRLLLIVIISIASACNMARTNVVTSVDCIKLQIMNGNINSETLSFLSRDKTSTQWIVSNQDIQAAIIKLKDPTAYSKYINDKSDKISNISERVAYREKMIGNYLRLLNENKYKAQAFGITINSKRILVLNFGTDYRLDTNDIELVCDGGARYALVYFDIDSMEVLSWRCNGEA